VQVVRPGEPLADAPAGPDNSAVDDRFVTHSASAPLAEEGTHAPPRQFHFDRFTRSAMSSLYGGASSLRAPPPWVKSWAFATLPVFVSTHSARQAPAGNSSANSACVPPRT